MNVIAMKNIQSTIGHISIHLFKRKTEVLQSMFPHQQPMTVEKIEQYVDRLNAHKYTLERLKEAIAFFLDNAGTRYKYFPKIGEFLEFKGTPQFDNKKPCDEDKMRTAENITRKCWKTYILPIEFKVKITKEQEAISGKNIASFFALKQTEEKRALKAFERWVKSPLATIKLPEPRDIYLELLKVK